MVERHNAYVRRNPSGHKELVIKKKGKPDEETLNELVESLMGVLEGIDYSGPLPSGGGAGSPEQLDYQKNRNQPDTPLMVGSRGDSERAAGESPNNMTSSTSQESDGPETSRVKSRLRATARGTPSRNKYISGYYGDNIDLGATHSESFTGTGAIAIVPSAYQIRDDDDEDAEDDEDTGHQSENIMTKKNVINEWDPAFQAAGYEPGDYQMPSPTGDGVAKRKSKQDTVGKYDTATQSKGKEWPRKHSETAAMCDVDDDGVEGKPQGGHKTTHGEASDGHQTPVGHNWPDQAKNSGSGVAEPMSGTRWSDGGTLTGGSGQDELQVKKGGSKMPSKGPIKGTRGAQNGQPSESWSPALIGRLLGEEYDLQALFDAYAYKHQVVCLEDFQLLCHAHGITAKLDEASILGLMHHNNDFIFYEGVDANGPYWTATPFANNGAQGGRQRPFESIKEMQVRDPKDEAGLGDRLRGQDELENPTGMDDMGDVGDTEDMDGGMDDMDGGMDDMGGGMDDMGDDMDAGAIPGDPDSDSDYAEDESNGPGPYGMHNAPYDECPECGYLGSEEECPECGAMIKGGSGENDLVNDRQLFPSPADVDEDDEFYTQGGDDEFGPEGGLNDMDDFGGEMGDMGGEGPLRPIGPPIGDDDMGMDDMDDDTGMDDMGMDDIGVDDEVSGGAGAPLGDWPKSSRRTGKPTRPDVGSDISRDKLFDPDVQESIKHFMVSARNIIDQNRDADRRAIGEALTTSWKYHVPGFDARRAPTKVQMSLNELAKRFPRFNPLTEGDAMDKLGGTAIGMTGGGPKDAKFLAPGDQPGMEDMKELGEPLGKKQKNNLEGTPTIKGTEKNSVKENVEKLTKYVQKQLREGASSLRGKFGVSFACLVQEADGRLNRTSRRVRLVEAVTDLEELLQFHKSNKVVLEAAFYNTKKVVLMHRIPMLPVRRHNPMVTEDRALFRFNRHAEQYAQHLVEEGFTCKLVPHNWGAAVQVLSEKKKWLQDVENNGDCTPMSKSTCTPRKKALAKRFKKGGDLYSGSK